MMNIMKSSIVLLLSLSVIACTWVELSPEGEKVAVVTADQITGCKRVGKTTVKSAAKIAGLERHGHKVEAELNTLARNSAPEIGGDTVVPIATPVDGKQLFEVYRCKQ
ncbi:MAG: DUF4156 domain-containing protein [Gammaproteobacteria bacterium]|nr:DUF4156 domain-containing protein [Gammaproteobacteria bacterium]